MKRIVGLIIFWSLMCNARILRKSVIFMCVPDLPGNKKHYLYNAQHWYFEIFLVWSMLKIMRILKTLKKLKHNQMEDIHK